MKELNSNKKETQLFVKDNCITGFKGFVEISNSNIYIDTRTGKGYSEAIKKFDKLINYFANKYHFSGFTFEDNKQHIIMHILESIPKFDPRKKVKLSTFIQVCVSRKLINEIRNENVKTKNATTLNIYSFAHTCKCGYSETFTLNKGQKCDKKCFRCGSLLKEGKQTSINFSEIPVGCHMYGVVSGNTEGTNCDFVDSIEYSTDNQFLRAQNYTYSVDDYTIYKYDLKKWLKNEDPLLVKIINLVYYNNYSIKSAAKRVGISGAWAHIKLKKLKDKHIVKEIFNRV